MVIEIQNFDDLKSKLEEAGNTLVVIDFYASWCGPCSIIAPKVAELAEEMDNVIFLKVDVDECQAITDEYEIESMPTFVFIKNGKVLESFTGASYYKLKSTIRKHM